MIPKTAYKKGDVPWITEKKHSEESKNKMKKSLKGRKAWNKGKKNHYESWCKGKNNIKISKDKHYLWKGGKTIKQGYLFLLKPEHPNAGSIGYIKNSRFIMSQHLNRPLKSTEIVHHINGNKLDDRIENLTILNRSEHAKHHAQLRRRISPIKS